MSHCVEIALLIEQSRANPAELGNLLERYRGFLWLMAQQRLGPRLAVRCDPADVTQQTLSEASYAFADFLGTSELELSAWLKQIHLRNLNDAVRTHVVAQSRSVTREVPLFDPEGSVSFYWHEPVAEQTTPSQRLVRAEKALRLAELLQALPDNQRDAVRLRHIEGWPIEQIARHLNRSITATAGLLKRGLQSLRGQMSADSWI